MIWSDMSPSNAASVEAQSDLSLLLNRAPRTLLPWRLSAMLLLRGYTTSAGFPLRARPLSGRGEAVSDLFYTASRPTPSHARQGGLLKGRTGAATAVATTAQPTSEVRALAQVPMTARHSFSPPPRGSRRHPLSLPLVPFPPRPLEASTHRSAIVPSTSRASSRLPRLSTHAVSPFAQSK